MTIIFTLVGVLVFFVSCFTVGFKSAFKRLAGFAITGVILDALLGTLMITLMYCNF